MKELSGSLEPKTPTRAALPRFHFLKSGVIDVEGTNRLCYVELLSQLSLTLNWSASTDGWFRPEAVFKPVL